MGECEPWDIYMHAMLRNSSQSWSPYFKAMGNEKSNSYWEAEMPSNVDRNGTGTFIRAKYEAKRWASKKPTQESEEQNNNVVKGATKNYNRQHTRRHSLDEANFLKPMEGCAPLTRPRGASLDMKDHVSGIGPAGKQMKESITNKNVFNLLYIDDAQKETSNGLPTRWATFD